MIYFFYQNLNSVSTSEVATKQYTDSVIYKLIQIILESSQSKIKDILWYWVIQENLIEFLVQSIYFYIIYARLIVYAI